MVREIEEGGVSKYTPGPWRVSDGDDLWVAGPISTDNVICDIVPRDADSYTEEDEANAALIAAAPDLLEACKRALSGAWLHATSGHSDAVAVHDELRAAIARATGASERSETV